MGTRGNAPRAKKVYNLSKKKKKTESLKLAREAGNFWEKEVE